MKNPPTKERAEQINNIKNLVAEGLTYLQIAERLDIPESSVRLTSIMWKDRNP